MPKHLIKAARAEAKAPIHGGSELALKGDISGGTGLCSELKRRMRVSQELQGRGGRANHLGSTLAPSIGAVGPWV